jgi:uncharacterized RDD family membrane protein YckC
MFCSKCGSGVADGTLFCAACGQPVAGVPAGPISSAPVASAPMIAAGAQNVAYAGFWLRFVAYLIDSAVVGAAFLVVVLVSIPVFGIGYLQQLVSGLQNSEPDFSPALIFVIFDLIFAISVATWLYYAFMESSTRQGTLGKMAMGLTVTDMQGQRVSFGRATGRFFAKIITGLVPLFIGYIMAGFTAKRQALHDMIASCLVMRRT